MVSLALGWALLCVHTWMFSREKSMGSPQGLCCAVSQSPALLSAESFVGSHLGPVLTMCTGQRYVWDWQISAHQLAIKDHRKVHIGLRWRKGGSAQVRWNSHYALSSFHTASSCCQPHPLWGCHGGHYSHCQCYG